MIKSSSDVSAYLDTYHSQHGNFKQAVLSWFKSVEDTYLSNSNHIKENIIKRMIEPDRVIAFKVPWRDDEGQSRLNTGWRVQHSNLFGPYKGGLRFSAQVDVDTFKFLAFEQTSKNILTGLDLGGGKGGLNVNPSALSGWELERVIQSFMIELNKYIGPDSDVPAGDIGVGEKEVAMMYAAYQRLNDRFDGAMTGKWSGAGGSFGRVEATGYGVVYLLNEVLHAHNEDLQGRSVFISGAGNVALHTAEKALELGADVYTLSNSKGTLYAPDGFTTSILDEAKENRLETIERDDCEFYSDTSPWEKANDIAIPCATQNEVDCKEAKLMTSNGLKLLIEGANMPLTGEAERLIEETGIIYVPAKAANAGGVAVSSMEMTQNSLGYSWTSDEVTSKLKSIMTQIHQNCIDPIEKTQGRYNYKRGADIAAYKRWAEGLMLSGV